MKYPVVEIFHSIQGEGAHVGLPATFIRLAGCNLKCEFCDTPNRNEVNSNLTPAEIVTKIGQTNSSLIVITGGEPTIHDLNPLVATLTHKGFKVVIETNGTCDDFPLKAHVYREADSVHYSIGLKPGLNIHPAMLRKAGSIKYLCSLDTSIEQVMIWADAIHLALHIGPAIFLQPIVQPGTDYMNNPTIMHTVKLCEATGLRLSLQIHKILGVE